MGWDGMGGMTVMTIMLQDTPLSPQNSGGREK